MKCIVATLVALTFLQNTCSAGQNRSKDAPAPPNARPTTTVEKNMNQPDSKETLRQVCQATLDLPGLEQYFHPTEPDRKPLIVVRNEALSGDVGLKKFGEPVKLVRKEDIGGKPAFEFTSIEIDGAGAKVAFRYAVEGIRGHVELKREDGKWRVVSSDIAET
jgi:hypothetical protein